MFVPNLQTFVPKTTNIGINWYASAKISQFPQMAYHELY